MTTDTTKNMTEMTPDELRKLIGPRGFLTALDADGPHALFPPRMEQSGLNVFDTISIPSGVDGDVDRLVGLARMHAEALRRGIENPARRYETTWHAFFAYQYMIGTVAARLGVAGGLENLRSQRAGTGAD